MSAPGSLSASWACLCGIAAALFLTVTLVGLSSSSSARLLLGGCWHRCS
jgi:hypothetical protein